MCNVKILESQLSDEEKKRNLKNLYYTIVKIAKQQKERNIDVSDCFYTKEEYEKLKREEPESFI